MIDILLDLQAYVKRSGPFAFYQDSRVNPILSAMHPHSTMRWRVAMRAFTGDELQQGILPPWVTDVVMRGKIPPMPQTHKVSFTLEAVGALRSHITVQVCSDLAAMYEPGWGGILHSVSVCMHFMHIRATCSHILCLLYHSVDTNFTSTPSQVAKFNMHENDSIMTSCAGREGVRWQCGIRGGKRWRRVCSGLDICWGA